jgi:preprotein translocase subunit YajC
MNLLFVQGDAPEVLTGAGEVVGGVAAATTATQGQAQGQAAPAPAQQEAPSGGGMGLWIMIAAMIAIMYFFMWRPEKKRRKQMEQFRQGLKKGDKIITAGGIYGVIKEVDTTSLLIEVDSNVTLRIDKNMVVGDPSQNAAR